MENKTPADKILDEVLCLLPSYMDIEREDCLFFARRIAELAFDAGWNHCNRISSPLVGNESWQTPPPPDKEQFIKELFNTK
jgi:hypothetical protein